MYELCQHLLASGRRCTQPAVAPTPYCRHHGIVKRTVASSILPPQFHHLHRALPFLYPEDRASIQANCFLVMRALDDRRITTQTANAMNRLLRTCQANLKPGPLHESDNKKETNAGAPSFRPVLSGERVGEQSSGLGSGLSGEHNNNAGAPRLDSETWDKEKSDPSIVRRVILTPAGEEIAPPLEVWEDGEEPHHGGSCPCRRCAAAPEPHHPNCRCGQCPTTPENDNVGAPRLDSETWDQSLSGSENDNAGAPSSRPVPSGERARPELAEGVGEQDSPPLDSSLSEEDDGPFTFYDGDPVPPDPYAAEQSEEERKQDEERRTQILDKHKERLDKVEKQYLYTPQLADRLRDEIQQIMELEMGPEAFSYQPLHPPAS